VYLVKAAEAITANPQKYHAIQIEKLDFLMGYVSDRNLSGELEFRTRENYTNIGLELQRLDSLLNSNLGSFILPCLSRKAKMRTGNNSMLEVSVLFKQRGNMLKKPILKMTSCWRVCRKENASRCWHT
jgi:hypothetical protein